MPLLLGFSIGGDKSPSNEEGNRCNEHETQPAWAFRRIAIAGGCHHRACATPGIRAKGRVARCYGHAIRTIAEFAIQAKPLRRYVELELRIESGAVRKMHVGTEQAGGFGRNEA
jgi:hypothetical protein